MIKELMYDPLFLTEKSETAAKEDLQLAQDLLDTLMFYKDSAYVGLRQPWSICPTERIKNTSP